MLDRLSSELLDYAILENTVREWLVALAVVVLVHLLIRLFIRAGVSRLSVLAKGTDTIWDDAATTALAETRGLFIVVIALFAGSLLLALPDRARAAAASAASLAMIIQAGLWLNAMFRYWLRHEGERRRRTDPATATTVGAVGFIGRLVLWSVVVILLLDNLGVDVTALVAGLGVGGIAVALAVQNILGDLFASLSIVLDKPFAVGDFLIIDEHLGAVENVGLKTTRLRSLSGEQLVFSNADLLKSRIRNFGRMYERRVVFKIGVTYQTPREKLKAIPAIIRDAVEQQENTRFDRAHFQAYGDFALTFENVYYVLAADYNLYMDVQQAINLHIHERFEQEGIEFAYPTRTIFIQQGAAAGATD